MPVDPRSFFRRWRVLILFGVLVVVVLLVMREFLDFPIADRHLAVINEMSLASPRARQRLEQYYAKHQRQTVASKHYPWLCNEMQELAADDGTAPAGLPDCPIPFKFNEKP